MFGLFRKKKEIIAAPAPRTPGFFSTDFEKKFGKLSMDQIIERAQSVKLPKLVPLDNEGKALFGMDESMAMDSDIQEAKYLNSGMIGIIPPLPQLDWYASQTFIGYQTCAIIAQQWLVDKACTMPARDAVRNGYELTVNDGTEIKPQVFEFIKQRDKFYGIHNQMVQFVRFGRIFGIRVALYDVRSSDPDYYEKPFNPDGVTPGSYKGIVQIDPYWIMPMLDQAGASNPMSHHFYEPTWWLINGKRVHRTHLCVMRNGIVPDILKPTYFYGGIPVPQKIAERVYAAERTANEAPMLALSKRMTIYKMDLTEAAGNIEKLKAKLSAWAELMNNFGIKAIGGEEAVEQHDLSLGDLDAVIMTQYQLVAAIADVPSTKLLGTSPKGFNATGEYEEKSYHEFLESVQMHDMQPLLEGHHIRLMRSEVCPKFGIAPFRIDTNWLPTDSPTAKEQADINLVKAQTDNMWVQAGAVDSFDVRQRVSMDRDSGYNGIPEIVPDGPGDRIAEQEAKEALEQPITAKPKGQSGGGEE